MKDSHRKLIIASCAIAIVAAFALSANAQQIEKLDAVLASPTINTDRGDGYGFEMRGNIYPKNTPFACDLTQDANRVGRYLLKVRQNKADGLIATWQIVLNDGRVIIWDSYSKYELDESGNPLSFSYEAVILRSSQHAITDFTPQSPACFGGKLVLYFLNGG